MTGQGWVTGSDIISKPTSKEYREGWERIFGKNRPITNGLKLDENTFHVCYRSAYLDTIEDGDRPKK